MDPQAAVAYGALTRSGRPFQAVRLTGSWATGLVRFRSPLLAEPPGHARLAPHAPVLMSFPPGTEMFQFPGFASRPYVFRSGYPSQGGLPHSDIPGSQPARGSPGLIAACHVLHRLLAPRHPPDALLVLAETLSSRSPRTAPTRAARDGQSPNDPAQASLSQTHMHSHAYARTYAHTHDAPDAHKPGPIPKDGCQTQAVPRAPRAPQPQFTTQRSRHANHPAATPPAPQSKARPRQGIPQTPPQRARPNLRPFRRRYPGDASSGDDRDRTGDPLLAKQVLSQLSYAPQAMNPPGDGPQRWAREDLNLRPHAYQACALTN